MVVTKTRFAAGILMAQRANLLPAPERIHHVLPKSFK
jgi:hypothetical protein